jgi:hypothetical protein
MKKISIGGNGKQRPPTEEKKSYPTKGKKK